MHAGPTFVPGKPMVPALTKYDDARSSTPRRFPQERRRAASVHGRTRARREAPLLLQRASRVRADDVAVISRIRLEGWAIHERRVVEITLQPGLQIGLVLIEPEAIDWSAVAVLGQHVLGHAQALRVDIDWIGARIAAVRRGRRRPLEPREAGRHVGLPVVRVHDHGAGRYGARAAPDVDRVAPGGPAVPHVHGPRVE